MSKRSKSFRFAIALSAIITISSLTFAATSWTDVLTPLPFASASTSVNDGSANAEPVVEPRRIDGKRVDMGENSMLVPLVGTYNIPGDYPDLAAAITDLNTQGVGGAVTLNLLAGNPQTAPAGGYVVGGTGSLVLTTTSMTNTVTIQGNGNTITAPTTHVVGSLTDSIFKLIGADWITVSGFVMNENAANTTTAAASNNMTEFGVALFYVTTTDGAQNDTIQGNTIDLDRTYQNTFGIYSTTRHASGSLTTAEISAPSGATTNTKIYGNTITDVNMGIVMIGALVGANMDTGLDIGGTSAPSGNILTNYGTTGTFSSYPSVSGSVNGILINNQLNSNVSFNSITSSVGGVTGAFTERGIYSQTTGTLPGAGTFTRAFNNNSISVRSAAAASPMLGIADEGGSSILSVTINNNDFNNTTHTVASSGAITFISKTTAPQNTTISNNTFSNLSVNTTGSVTFITANYTIPAGGTQNVNGNSIVTAFNKTGAGGTVTLFLNFGSSTGTVTEQNNNNNFSNITVTGATTLNGWRSTDGGSPIKTVTNNTFSNWTGGTSQLTGLAVSFSGSATVTGNTVSNFSCACVIVGVETSSGNQTLSQNTVNTLTGSGTGVVTGILNSGGTTQTIARNKVYGISNTNAAGGASGITVSSGTTVNLINNLVGDITAPILNATNSLFGINVSGGTTVSADFNTVYVNASSTGVNFGSSAINVSSTPTTTLRNNIFVNLSTPNGTGLTVAHRRTTTTLTTYASASNNNLFYAGIPSATKLIFNDGTNSDQTLAAYKTRVASRDSSSVTENPPFLSTTGSSGNFLHISSVTPTQVEGGAIPVGGITDDYDGDTRNGVLPDIGADEFTGIPIDLSGPNITYAPLSNTGLTTNRVLNATIADASGVAGGAFAPRIYFRKNAGSYFSTQCGAPTGNVYPCTIDNSLVGGVAASDVISYFVVAQDTLGNVSANPSGGFSATDVNNVTTPPTTPNSYMITGTISGNKNVGVGGDYPTLTAAVAALNNNDISGPVTLTLTDASYAEAVPFTINANAGSSAANTVTIKPAAGVSPTISGSSTSCIINFNGADYMTIDGSNALGGTSRDLTITNTSTGTSSAVVCMTSLGAGAGATNDTVKNTNLVGSTVTATNGTLFGVFSGSSTISTSSNGVDNDSNTVQNNSIRKTQIGIYSGGESAANKNTGTVISQNVMNAASPNNLNNGGIYVRFDAGATISQNDISVLRHDGTAGQTGTAFGIALGLIPSNTFLTFTGSDVTGATVTRNRIGPVTQLHSTGYSGFGLVVNSVTSGTTLVANNMVSEVRAASTASDFSAGIVAGGGTGSTTQVYFNSVSMTGSRNSADYPSYGLAINTGDPVVDVRNNIFLNTQSSTDIGLMYAIGTGSDTFANLTSNYNNFFVSGTGTFVGRTGGLGPILGTDQASLASWQAAISDDANSQSIDPLFVSATDLHLQGTSPILDDGTPIGAVTVDFDGDTRSLTTPDIGADEIGGAPAPGTIQFSSATYSVGEAGPNATLTVTRTGGSSGAVTVNYALSGGTATGGATCGGSVDYDNDGGSVMFADGDAADKTFNVPVCDDATFEGDETFDATLSIGSGSATLGTPNPATVTITDNDSAPTAVINVSDLNFGNVIVGQTIQLNATIQNTGTATLNVGTVSIAGTNAADFNVVTSPNGMTVAPGNSIQFPISFTPSSAGARSATYTVNSNASSGDNVGNLGGTGTQPGTLTLSSATYLVNEGAGTATITVNRTGGTDGAVSVSYGSSNGTATGGASCTAGVDYIPASGMLSWTNGESTSKTFNITVCDDSLFESNETVNVSITLPTGGATLGSPNTAVLTVNENDTAPTLQFSSATYSNNDDFAPGVSPSDEIVPEVATITVTRTGATENAVSVNYATVAGGSATAGMSCGTGSGVDYISTNGTLNFAAGVTMQTFNVTVCSDSRYEGDETVNLALSSPSMPGVLGGQSSSVLTIVDNDTIPTLQFNSATYTNSDDLNSLGETTAEFAPSVATITVTRTGAVDNAVSVDYATMGGTATGGVSCTAGIDYISTSGTLSFGAGVVSQSFNVTVCTDMLFEGNETVNLALSNPSASATLGMPNSAVLTIVDNDVQPSVQFNMATYSVGEAGPTATITVTRTGAPDNAVSVNYATSNGTATGGALCSTPGVDYVSGSGTLNFAAGITSQTFNVPICDDATAESTETINLALTSPTGAVLGAQSTAVLSIIDNDAAPTLQFSSATYSAAENVAGGIITLTVTRSGATGNALTVDYGTGGGTATAGACVPGVDYNTASGTLNFGSGVTSQTFNVTICNDSVYELNQTFNATLTNPTGGATLGTPNPATVTVNNDDSAPTVTINDITLAEGNSGTTNFQTTFTITGANEVSGGFNFQTADNTATAPSDYTAIASTAVVVPANVNRTTAMLNGSIVLVNGDTTPETNETFFLNGSSCTDCSFADNQGVATITNDDSTLQFSTATSSVGEGAGSATLTVSRNGLGFPVTVDYSLGGGTATGGGVCGGSVDYVNTGGTLNFAANDTSKNIIVTICDDATAESPETFVATLSNATGGAVIVSPTTQTVTINDNEGDMTPPTVSYTPLTNVATVQDRVFTVTATDNVGVTAVTVVWRNNDGGVGNFSTNPCSPSGGTPQNGTWTCTILSGVGTQTNPGTVDYFVSADDAALNSATSPAGATVNGGTWNLYTIGSGGTINVGTINTFQNLIVGSGFTLGGNALVTGNLTLSGGIIDTGSFKLSLGCGATITGGGEFNYVVGTLERAFCGVETFTFPVGAAFVLPPVAPDSSPLIPEGTASNYSPLTATITAGTAGSSLEVKAYDAFLTGFDPARSISRNWSILENGNLTANLAFTYRNEDVNGNEADYRVYRSETGGPVTNLCPSAPCVNAATNTASVSGISTFSRWTVAELLVPTAAPVSLSGRVVNASGQGIRNAVITIEGGGLSEPRMVLSSSFGYYTIDGLSIGTYLVTINSKRYTFAVPSRIVTLSDDVTGLDFVAEPQE